MNYPQHIVDFILGALFPVNCISCGRFSAENRKEYICKKCLQSIPVNKSFECIGCKKSSPLGKTCWECREKCPIDHLFVVSDYKNRLIRRSLKTFKYRFVTGIADSFTPSMKKYIHRLASEKNFSLAGPESLIIPIPLHKRRMNWRGFNQAEVIAKIISEILYSGIRTDILVRTKNSGPQAEADERAERFSNMRGAFTLSASGPLLKDKTIILVDDVCTTGATLNEAAGVLKEAGASNIIGFVIARG